RRSQSSFARVLVCSRRGLPLRDTFPFLVSLIGDSAGARCKPPAGEISGGCDSGSPILRVSSTQHDPFVARPQAQWRGFVMDMRGADSLRSGLRQCRELRFGKIGRNLLRPYLRFGWGAQPCRCLFDLVGLIPALLMPGGRLLRRSCSMARDRIFDELRLENVDLFLDGVADDVVKKLVGDVILALGDVPRPPTVLLCHRLRGS